MPPYLSNVPFILIDRKVCMFFPRDRTGANETRRRNGDDASTSELAAVGKLNSEEASRRGARSPAWQLEEE